MKILITAFLVTLFVDCGAQTIQPVEQTVGKLHVSIDPRIELLSTIQILADYRVINKTSSYSNEIQDYFDAFSSHKAVDLTNRLVNNNGFTFDAPVTFMLYLSQPPGLKRQSPYSDYLVSRAGSPDNLNAYRKSIEQFAKEADFEKFWVSKKDFYTNILDLTIADLKGEDFISVIEDYFNEKQNSYNIIIAPLFNGGNYGPRIIAPNNKYDIYACNTPTNTKNGIPYIGAESIYETICHEFGHSFVNPETEKYLDRLNASRKLFEPIKSQMKSRAYDLWSICINEHIVRAVNIRLVELQKGTVKSREMISREIGNRFIYIEPLVAKLKEFEKQRDSKHITFAQFFPQLLDVLDSLSKTDYLKLAEYKFRGPINSVTSNQRVAWIYPTHDQDTASLKIVKDYVTRLYNRFKSEGSILVADSIALNTSLSDYGLMVYGTIESNLLLSKYKETFPFTIKDHVLLADKEYKDENTRFISCLPNPQNPLKGMAVYTAFDNKNIKDINNVFHGPEDFIVFINRENVISKSYYDKTKEWKFIK